MRPLMPREFYIPKHARPVETAGTDAAVWTYEQTHDGATRWYALGFHGKAQKPDWHLRFRSEERRTAHIAEYLDGRRRRGEAMAERHAKHQLPHSLTVGTILHSSWGYDQTNVEFYEVTRVVSPRMVEIRELAQVRTEDAFMQGTCAPRPGVYCGPATRHRVSADNTIRLESYKYAWVGGGQQRWTAYA